MSHFRQNSFWDPPERTDYDYEAARQASLPMGKASIGPNDDVLASWAAELDRLANETEGYRADNLRDLADEIRMYLRG